MIQLRSILDVADNTGAKRVAMIGVLGKKNCMFAVVGDIINVNVKESAPEAIVKKGEVGKAVVVRTCDRAHRARQPPWPAHLPRP